MNRLTINQHISIPSVVAGAVPLRFEMQPIVKSFSLEVDGYELLYRGTHSDNWGDVDAALIAYLAQPRNLPLLYVNISNHGLLTQSVAQFDHASTANAVIFELSESVVGYSQREAIAHKVNEMISRGILVAVDDFGAGRDSLERLYSLDRPVAVKIDRLFTLTCMRRSDAKSTLLHMIQQWKSAGITTIVEGVEDCDVLSFAREIGADMVQGWHVDAMVAASQFRDQTRAA